MATLTLDEILEKASQKIPQKEFIRLLGERSRFLKKEARLNELKMEELRSGTSFQETVARLTKGFEEGKLVENTKVDKKELSSYAEAIYDFLKERGESLGHWLPQFMHALEEASDKIAQLQNRNEAYQKELRLIDQQLTEMPEIFPAPPTPGQPSPGDAGFD